jgi:medium-chain acyl-[acyl-carrier-protein] hydrolase
MEIVRPHSWWNIAKPNPRALLRLLCFPYAGGSASIFQSWHMSLPDHVEVRALQLPGRANRIREAPFTRILPAIAEIGKHLPFDAPFAFFGHSMGAVLAFEMARWLQRSGRSLPRCLFVSGRRAPQVLSDRAPIHQQSRDDFLASIVAMNGMPAGVQEHTELLRVVLPMLRADCELAETYEYQSEPPLTCPITAIGGSDDDEACSGGLDGWQAQTAARFSVHLLAGDHFYIHSAEGELLRILSGELSAGLVRSRSCGLPSDQRLATRD